MRFFASERKRGRERKREKEKERGRWCLASTAAFYLSVSSRHSTDRIETNNEKGENACAKSASSRDVRS